MTAQQQNYEGMHILRTLACMLVVLSHAVPYAFSELTPLWQSAVFYKSFIRVCVPIFLMITGYLLIDRKEDINVFYAKRANRVVPPFIAYMILYFLLIFISKQTMPTFADFWYFFFIKGGTMQMWYLYGLIGIYAFVPFLKIIFQNSSIREKNIFLCLWLATTSILPFIFFFIDNEFIFYQKFAFYQFFGNIGYVYLGAYVKHIEVKRKNLFIFGYFVFSIISMAATYIHSYSVGVNQNFFFDRGSPFVIIATVCLFMACKDLKMGKYAPYITEISKYSFGIYLIHVAVYSALRKVHLDAASGYYWISRPLIACLVFIISFYLIRYAKKIPYLRRIAG